MAEKTKNEKRPLSAGKIIRLVIVLILLGVMAFSGMKLYKIYYDYDEAADVFRALETYKPAESAAAGNTDNQSIIDLQAKYPDVCGWLTIDGTKMDYLYAQSEDNEYYLHNSPDGEYIVSGTLFLDCRCARDFSGFNSIIYGHNMKDNSMFGELEKFEDGEFFSEHRTGTVYLPHDTYELEIFAYMIIDDEDKIVYDAGITETADKERFLSYVQEHADQYSDIGVTAEDTILTLSTCNYSFSSARSVLIARVVK